MSYILLLLLTFGAWAQREKVDPISFGNVSLAEDRMPLKLSAFVIKNAGNIFLRAKLVEHTLQWVRLDEVLLVPRALLQVQFTAEPGRNFTFTYGNQKVIPLFDAKNNIYKTQTFVSLFEAIPLELYENDQIMSTIRVLPTSESSPISQLIDYSCAPYYLEITGLVDDFVSVGCKIQRTGRFGDEKPYLEVLITSASYRLKDQSAPPYNITFHETGTAKMTLVSYDGREETLSISAKVPERLPRLRLAWGAGPYTLYTKSETQRKNQIAPTLMLYGNLALNAQTSLRFFDSYSRNVSTFHNWGAYFAWDLARFCDQRCQLTSLIGAQGVGYQFNSGADKVSEVIYPQGFEFVYSHPFGQLNYKLSYGMFASLSTTQYNYKNLWLRYGKGWFLEANYIEWSRDEWFASMFGLSVGFPLVSFF